MGVVDLGAAQKMKSMALVVVVRCEKGFQSVQLPWDARVPMKRNGFE